MSARPAAMPRNRLGLTRLGVVLLGLAVAAGLPVAGYAAPAARTTAGAAVSAYEPGWSVTLSAPRARPGDRVRVAGESWPAGQLIQLVTCGELALPGSSSCDMRAALATVVRADGTFAVELTVGEPPRPCPCVVHAAAVGQGAGGHVDTPLEVSGHPTGPVPVPARNPAAVEVVEARLTGGAAVAAWFGGAQTRTLVYTVRNAGTETLRGLPLTVRLGRAADAVPAPASGDLAPGETRTYEIAVPIPFAAFGAYPVTAELGGLGRAQTTHQAYPWGFVLLDVLGAVLIGWAALRLVRRRRARGAGPALAVDDAVLLPAVVRVPDLGAYLVFDDAPGAGRMRRLAGGQLAPEDLRRLLERGAAQQPTAVIDLQALDAYLTGHGRG